MPTSETQLLFTQRSLNQSSFGLTIINTSDTHMSLSCESLTQSLSLTLPSLSLTLPSLSLTQTQTHPDPGQTHKEGLALSGSASIPRAAG